LKASVGRQKITPNSFLPLGGNIRSDSMARGTHDELYCDIVILSQDDFQVCLLEFDLLGLQFETCQYMKECVSQATGIPKKQIVVTASHTHSGPDTAIIFKDKLDPRVLEYLKETGHKVAERAREMMGELSESKLAVGAAMVTDRSFNRRLVLKDGSLHMNWEGVDPSQVVRTTGPIDPALGVIAIYGADGTLKGVIVNFTLHPAVLVGKDWLYSKDYIHYLEITVKEALGKDVQVFFTNGAEGNINHLNYRDANQPRGFVEIENIGRALGKKTVEAVQNAKALPGKLLKCADSITSLPVRHISKESVEWARALIAERGDEIPSLLDGDRKSVV